MGEKPQSQSQSLAEPSGGAYKNEQYLRLIREEDESWISGEELRTDGSSEDEKLSSQHLAHNKKKVKTRPKLMRCDSDDPPKEISFPVVPLPYRKPRFETDLPRTESASAAEDPSAEAGCSRRLSDSVDLENRWRPKRGPLEEFYSEMSQTIAELKSFGQQSRINVQSDGKFDEIKEKIHSLDLKLKENSELLQMEHTERLETQNALCADIMKNSQENRNTSIFLEMCKIRSKSIPVEKGIEFKDSNELIRPKSPQKHSKTTDSKDFIKRNAELASKMNTKLAPLTNDEEVKLQVLLADIGNEEGDEITSEEIPNFNVENEESDEDYLVGIALRNAFKFSDGDERKIGEIDGKLGNFEDEDSRPTRDLTSLKSPLSSSAPSAVAWEDLALAQALKEINVELEKFQNHPEIDPI